MERPILFLDFDRTLFDTNQFYQWLGEDIDGRIAQLVDGEIAGPNFAAMLYSDTTDFLIHAQKTHQLVLLTYTENPALQEKKIRGSGITPYFGDILMTNGDGGGLGKGSSVRRYLSIHAPDKGSMLVDDMPENLSEVKAKNPHIRCIRIDRVPREGVLAKGTPPDNVVTNLLELQSLL